jgi:hypothetical protein
MVALEIRRTVTWRVESHMKNRPMVTFKESKHPTAEEEKSFAYSAAEVIAQQRGYSSNVDTTPSVKPAETIHSFKK